jgi:hypothetical protein
MKKVLFLMILPFLLLGTASVRAQVRIGGSGTPHSAAVLDLNANNEPTPTGNQGGLALPRVELATVTMELNNTPLINGMLVYNTGGTLAPGVYVWMTDKWVKTSTGSVAYEGSESIKLDGTKFKREALTGDVTADENSNETTIGNGTVTSAKILDNTITANDIADEAIGEAEIADGAIVSSKLADASVNSPKLNAMGAAKGQILAYTGSSWAPNDPAALMSGSGWGGFVFLDRVPPADFPYPAGNRWFIPLACSPNAAYNLLFAVGHYGPSSSTIMDGTVGAVYTSTGAQICARTGNCLCLFRTF